MHSDEYADIFKHLYLSADEVLLKPTGAQLTVEFLEERSFSVPVLVLRKDGLGMNLPPSSFSVSDVEHYIGNNSNHIFSVLRFQSYVCEKSCLNRNVMSYDCVIGADKEIDVIDVNRQADLKMKLGEFVEYYNSPNRDRVLNVISLEFSDTRYFFGMCSFTSTIAHLNVYGCSSGALKSA